MQVFQAYSHWPNVDTQVFELAEEVKEVVRRQGKLRRSEVVGGEGQVGSRERLCQRYRGRRSRTAGSASDSLLFTILGLLALQLQRIR